LLDVSLLFSLTANNVATKWGAAAGILIGVAVVTYLTVTGPTLRAIFPSLGSIGHINVGIIALLANLHPRCRQPRYSHLDSYRQGRGIFSSYPESFAPRTFVARTIRHKLQEKQRASPGTRTGDTSIELWSSIRWK
jgi:hypothetical protein